VLRADYSSRGVQLCALCLSFVCVHARMCVCLYVCARVFVCACVCVCVGVCLIVKLR
jgi:hypothetical protein